MSGYHSLWGFVQYLLTSCGELTSRWFCYRSIGLGISFKTHWRLGFWPIPLTCLFRSASSLYNYINAPEINQEVLTNLVKETSKSELHRSMQMVPFTESEPFEYKVKCEEFSGLKLAVYHEKSNKNAKALCFFLHDFGVSAKNFGSLFH